MSIRVFTTFKRYLSFTSALRVIQTPISCPGLYGRYAAATYSAAKKENKLLDVENDLTKFLEVFYKDKPLRDLLLHPRAKRQLKLEAMTSIGEKMNFTAVTTNLLNAIAENDRAKLIPKIVRLYQDVVLAHNGLVFCEIVTARPLNSAYRDRLAKVCETFIKSGEKAKISERVDPNMLGGVILQIGDKLIDLSIVSRVTLYLKILRLGV